MPKLDNDKHERFANEFIIDLNGTKAYQRTYPDASYESARAASSELLTNLNILERIDALKAERAKSVKIDQESVLHDLNRYLNADVTEFVNITPEEIKKLPLEMRKMITGFTVKEKKKNGEVYETQYTWEFFDKKTAFEMVNKHIGFYEKDNSQQKQFQVIVTSNEEAKKLSEI